MAEMREMGVEELKHPCSRKCQQAVKLPNFDHIILGNVFNFGDKMKEQFIQYHCNFEQL